MNVVFLSIEIDDQEKGKCTIIMNKKFYYTKILKITHKNTAASQKKYLYKKKFFKNE